MTRRKVILLGGFISLGISAALLTHYLGAVILHADLLTRCLLDLLVVLLATGVPMACFLESAPPCRKRREEGNWLAIRLTMEGYDALHAIMATEGDVSEKEALDRLLVEQHAALRNNLLDR